MRFYTSRADQLGARRAFDRAEARRIAGQAAPITAIALVNMGMSITDTVMAAGLGAEALAGVAIASDFYSLLFYLIAGVIAGLGPLYASASGRGAEDCLCGLRGAGWFVTLLSAMLMVPVFWHAPLLFSAIGVGAGIVDAGRGYLAVMTLVLFPNAVVALYRARLTAIERPGLMLRVTLLALPLNALGNWVFMYGIDGWSGLGASGLAVSSLVVWSAIALALHILARRAEDGSGHLRIDLSKAAEIVRIGLPIGIMTIAEVGLFLGATIYVGTFSADEAAAHAIAIRLAGITYAASIGLNQATMVRVARNASGDGRRVIIASALGLAGFAGIALGVTLALVAFGLSVLGGFADEIGRAIALATPAIALLALMESVGPVGATAEGVLRGHRDTRAAMLVSLTGNWLIAAPAVFVLTQVLQMGVRGLWAGLACGLLASAIMMCGRLPRHWNNTSIVPRTGVAAC